MTQKTQKKKQNRITGRNKTMYFNFDELRWLERYKRPLNTQLHLDLATLQFIFEQAEDEDAKDMPLGEFIKTMKKFRDI